MDNILFANFKASVKSIANSSEFEKTADIVFRTDYITRQKEGLPIPLYLQNFCLICGSYINVVTTLNGRICESCQSIKDDSEDVEKSLRLALAITDNKGNIKKKLGNLSGSDVPTITRLYSKIAKDQKFPSWKMDLKVGVIGGYYYNDKDERIILTKPEKR